MFNDDVIRVARLVLVEECEVVASLFLISSEMRRPSVELKDNFV